MVVGDVGVMCIAAVNDEAKHVPHIIECPKSYYMAGFSKRRHPHASTFIKIEGPRLDVGRRYRSLNFTSLFTTKIPTQ